MTNTTKCQRGRCGATLAITIELDEGAPDEKRGELTVEVAIASGWAVVGGHLVCRDCTRAIVLESLPLLQPAGCAA